MKWIEEKQLETKVYNFDNIMYQDEKLYEIHIKDKYVYITDRDNELEFHKITDEPLDISL